jgi:hypothetical protein
LPSCQQFFSWIADPHHLSVDPDPAFHSNVDLDPDPASPATTGQYTLEGGLYFEPPGLHYERIRPFTALFLAYEALSFDFNADPDPAFYSNADPDPASKNMQILIRNPEFFSFESLLSRNGYGTGFWYGTYLYTGTVPFKGTFVQFCQINNHSSKCCFLSYCFFSNMLFSIFE